MAEFMLVAMNQVVNEAPRLRYMSGGRVKVPVVFKAGYGFTAGWAGQHTGSIYGMFLGIPGLKVVLPSTPADAKGLMATAIRDDNPVCYLMHYLLVLEHGDVPEGEYVVPFGEAAIRREGGDVTIVATGWTVGKALAAAETLAGEGIQAEVIDPRTLAPLDTATILSSVEKTGRLVIADQSTRHGGASPVIAAEVAEHGFSSLKAPIVHVTAHDVTVPYSEPMEAFVLPDEEKIAGRGTPGAGRSARRRLAAARSRCDWTRDGQLATLLRDDVADPLLRGAGRRQLKRTLQVHGLIHLSIGGEGVAAAVCGQLRDDDAVYSGHRAHGHAIAKGAPLDRVMAELMGRADGLCHGLGGSMHLVDVEHGFLGATGVVGGNLPLALGNALAAAVRGSDAGDGRVLRRRRRSGGALQRVGQPRRAVGAAGDLRLREQRLRRVHAALGAHRRRAASATSVAPYGFERKTVDGSDVAAVYEAFAELPRGRARDGRGPLLLECLTHRRRGHYEGDQQQLPRPGWPRSEWRRRDPIARLATRRSAGWLDEHALDELEADAARRGRRRGRVRSRQPVPGAGAGRRARATRSMTDTRRHSSRRSTPRSRGRCAPTSG